MYTEVTKNAGFIRQKSKESKSPSLPKEGAQKYAKQVHNAHLNNNAEFMKTPDAGQAGYVNVNRTVRFIKLLVADQQ